MLSRLHFQALRQQQQIIRRRVRPAARLIVGIEAAPAVDGCAAMALGRIFCMPNAGHKSSTIGPACEFVQKHTHAGRDKTWTKDQLSDRGLFPYGA